MEGEFKAFIQPSTVPRRRLRRDLVSGSVMALASREMARQASTPPAKNKHRVAVLSEETEEDNRDRIMIKIDRGRKGRPPCGRRSAIFRKPSFPKAGKTPPTGR